MPPQSTKKRARLEDHGDDDQTPKKIKKNEGRVELGGDSIQGYQHRTDRISVLHFLPFFIHRRVASKHEDLFFHPPQVPKFPELRPEPVKVGVTQSLYPCKRSWMNAGKITQSLVRCAYETVVLQPELSDSFFRLVSTDGGTIPEDQYILMHKYQSRQALLAACAGSLIKYKDSMAKQGKEMTISMRKYQRDRLEWEYKLAKAVGTFDQDKVDRVYTRFLVLLDKVPAWFVGLTANSFFVRAAEQCWTEGPIVHVFPWKLKKLDMVLHNLQAAMNDLDQENGHGAGRTKQPPKSDAKPATGTDTPDVVITTAAPGGDKGMTVSAGKKYGQPESAMELKNSKDLAEQDKKDQPGTLSSDNLTVAPGCASKPDTRSSDRVTIASERSPSNINTRPSHGFSAPKHGGLTNQPKPRLNMQGKFGRLGLDTDDRYHSSHGQDNHAHTPFNCRSDHCHCVFDHQRIHDSHGSDTRRRTLSDACDSETHGSDLGLSGRSLASRGTNDLFNTPSPFSRSPTRASPARCDHGRTSPYRIASPYATSSHHHDRHCSADCPQQRERLEDTVQKLQHQVARNEERLEALERRIGRERPAGK
ncbi:hypothetical protein BO78DRAFT_453496 [Aspergillus sclerotiicarbonarius CBS 121057]|uniref:Uncharacterized protein n=1 Tax=Aspergillus sclerotiicarbonarius (strain CBS 121057 / IBT 28362) TaxID=1448318 RepID=A0A319EFL9_ASPSB|nr:hypothetical protein BO78DRAFT_453496 [Aspergillus sclerotiicarbonarius CBS 121057]